MAKTPSVKTVEALKYEEARRKNIPTAEYQSVLDEQTKNPTQVRYSRKYTELLYQIGALHDLGKVSNEFQQKLNRDLDPQLIWRGKDEQDWSDLVVHAPSLYIQEKVHPKALINDLLRETKERRHESGEITPDLFADFNGISKEADKTEFYQHDQNWSNRMILGDSLQVMASLAEREGLRGKVQCIYLDPPYGIKFNSNFQWSTTSNKITDGSPEHITREPEQVKAFRDTWRDGIHSYLTYLRDRLMVARELLANSGSLFVQISDENVHLVRTLLDEVFGGDNSISTIVWKKGAPRSKTIKNAFNYILWYSKNAEECKSHKIYRRRDANEGSTEDPRKLALWGELPAGTKRPLTTNEKRAPWLAPVGTRIYRIQDLEGTGERFAFEVEGKEYWPRKGRRWRGNAQQFSRLKNADRISITDQGGLGFKFYVVEDSPVIELTNVWDDTAGNVPDMVYVVQTNAKIVTRCMLMATDAGDLVLDPTCGSGTTAYVAEQWGRRWITIDTSRVALALARARVMGAYYPFHLLADTREGQLKEAEVTRSAPSSQPVHGDIRHGFVYERVPHITLKAIANNTEIDVTWEKWQAVLEPLRDLLNAALEKQWREWEIPREAEDPWPTDASVFFYKLQNEQDKGGVSSSQKIADYLFAINENLKRSYTIETLPNRPADPWPDEVVKLHVDWWQARTARQQEIDASIADKADYKYLYDKPYPDNKKVRVAGPFTVESLSPHRMLGVDENDELIDTLKQDSADYSAKQSFPQMILENLKTAGVQQAHKEDKITFTALAPWPGYLVCAEGRYQEGSVETGGEKRAAIFIGPEFGTVQRADLVSAAREAGDGGFDVLIACAFNYEAHATEFTKLGRIPVLKARMNADLHMAEDLKNTGKGNLFVIFGEPDITLLPEKDGKLRVKVNGVDVFKPQTGEVVSNGPGEIACWFIDTDYNEESFFVRHAYFLGANDPYSALKTTLKAEIDPEAWATLNSDTSRPFKKPAYGRIAVKVINHLGDEVMKVFRVQ
jgi:adenine-specific DNA-methyltransferase